MSQPTAAAIRFDTQLDTLGLPRLARRGTTTLQVNVGKLCNQACHHCHVEAGPGRKEIMTPETVERLLVLLAASPAINLVDVTGGAPELNPSFRRLVSGTRALGRDVIVRSNLTVLVLPGQEDTVAFFREQRVAVTASLPCYTAENVDQQRGDGVFEASLEGLRRLNAAGYGDPGSGLTLDLVYNPLGAFLPPEQSALEAAYHRELDERFGIRFNRLLTITNMPIKRFAEDLERQGRAAAYLQLLVDAFRAENVASVMCRDLVSVGWQGELYDCDFNQMLDMPIGRTIHDIDGFDVLDGSTIETASHCFGCTAGAGSSCGGALV